MVNENELTFAFTPLPMEISNQGAQTQDESPEPGTGEQYERADCGQDGPFPKHTPVEYKIFPCSGLMVPFIESYEDSIGETEPTRVTRWKTPIHQLKIGESFAHPIRKDDYQSLYIHMAHVAKKTGKKFKMKSHNKTGFYEVCRIA